LEVLIQVNVRAQVLAVAALTACIALAGSSTLPAAEVAVHHSEGLLHGFLALRTLGGTLLANGDIFQTVRGYQVTSRLVFHFKDGSLHDETTIFSQRDQFRLVSDRVVQKGPAFPRQLDMTINVSTGQVTVRYRDGDGKEEIEDEKLDLPADLANGILPVLLKNVTPGTSPVDGFLHRCHAEAADREARACELRNGHAFHCGLQPTRHSLCGQSGDRRSCRGHGTSRR
jgi:hypothetical protein